MSFCCCTLSCNPVLPFFCPHSNPGVRMRMVQLRTEQARRMSRPHGRWEASPTSETCRAWDEHLQSCSSLACVAVPSRVPDRRASLHSLHVQLRHEWTALGSDSGCSLDPGIEAEASETLGSKVTFSPCCESREDARRGGERDILNWVRTLSPYVAFCPLEVATRHRKWPPAAAFSMQGSKQELTNLSDAPHPQRYPAPCNPMRALLAGGRQRPLNSAAARGSGF